jgi:hypothetical protein
MACDEETDCRRRRPAPLHHWRVQQLRWASVVRRGAGGGQGRGEGIR